MKKVFISTIALLGLSSSLYSGEFGLELGVQKIELGGTVQYKGTKIDVQDDLGLTDTKTSFKPTLTYTSDNKKHKFFLNYESSDYNETTTLTRDITFNDKVYSVGSIVTTKAKTHWYQLGYRYNFTPLFDNQLLISAGLDVNIVDLETSLDATGIHEAYDVTAPLPTAVLDLKYYVTNKVAIETKGAFMTYGSYGDYIEYYAGLNLDIPSVKGLSLKAGYMYKDVEIEIKSDEKLDLDYSGAYAGLEYKF